MRPVEPADGESIAQSSESSLLVCLLKFCFSSSLPPPNLQMISDNLRKCNLWPWGVIPGSREFEHSSEVFDPGEDVMVVGEFADEEDEKRRLTRDFLRFFGWLRGVTFLKPSSSSSPSSEVAICM